MSNCDHSLKTTAIDVIIPARNEHRTIGAIIDAFHMATLIGKVIVVDDKSDDQTWFEAVSHNALVVKGNGEGKGQAVKVGLEFVSTSLVCLCDADLTNFTTKHAEMLMEGDCNSETIGIPEFSPNMPWAHKVKGTTLWGDLSGERCLPTGLIKDIPLHGYAMEVQINAAVARAGIKVVKIKMDGAKGVVKPMSYNQRLLDWARDMEWLKTHKI